MGLDASGAQERVTAWLRARDLEASVVREGRVMTMLSGEWKRTIPLQLHTDERSLRLTCLLVGRPDQGHEEVYRLLLQRNQRSGPVHFALDDDGEVVLVGEVPLDTLDEQRFDVLLGTVLRLADETFNPVLRAGFADYIEREQRWRAASGMSPNPVSESP